MFPVAPTPIEVEAYDSDHETSDQVTTKPRRTTRMHTISVLAEKTLPKTAYHFLLLLVGFDTLTYLKDYDRYPTLVGHQ